MVVTYQQVMDAEPVLVKFTELGLKDWRVTVALAEVSSAAQAALATIRIAQLTLMKGHGAKTNAQGTQWQVPEDRVAGYVGEATAMLTSTSLTIPLERVTVRASALSDGTLPELKQCEVTALIPFIQFVEPEGK